MDTETKLTNVGEDYFLNGEKLTRVTEVMVSAGLVSTDFFTEEGKMRGSAVHLACDFLVRKNLDWDSVHEKCFGYVKAAEKFLSAGIFLPIVELCDVRDFHPQYLYTGKPDWFGVLNGYHAIVEIKTGDSKTANLQTAAYAEMPLFKKYNPKRYVLELKKDGKFKLNKCESINDFAIFIKCLLECKKRLT